MTQHNTPSSLPAVPEPPHAERVRTLLESESIGMLSTQSAAHPGWPFGSVMPFALTENGSPLVLVSTMAVHTQNLLADPRASLLVMQSGGGADPLGSPRATLLGMAARVADPPPQLREAYLARHPSARYWIDFSDFAFFRLEVSDVYFVGGFGVMGWVTATDYQAAEPDPLLDCAAGILEHMNRDHAEALRLMARHFAGLEAEDASMVSCDRLGFVLRARTAEGMKGRRIAFPEEVRSSDEARRALVAMTRQARGDPR